MALNEEGRGPLRKLLGRVVERVVDAALGPSRPPDSRTSTEAAARETSDDIPKPAPTVDASAPATQATLPPGLREGEPVEMSALG
jgi:hypothetical protein